VTSPKLTFIPDILEEHYEELQYLWGHRQVALRSPRHVLRHLTEFEERMEAHVQGLLIAVEAMVPLVEGGLISDDPLEAFASGYLLLRSGDKIAPRALMAFANAKDSGLRGLTEAISHGPARAFVAQLQVLLGTGPPLTAIASAEILAFQGFIDAKVYRLDRFLSDDPPEVRRAAWRVAGLVGAPLDSKSYATAMRDDDASVRREALYAAAWARQDGVLALCRHIASTPSPESYDFLRLLAILGHPADLDVISVCGQSAALGPARFAVLGSFGHPSTMNLILEGIADPDAETAAAAGAAFTKMTGREIESDQIAAAGPAQHDEFDREFADQVTLPNPQAAFDHWNSVKAQLAGATRLCAGFDLGRGVSAEKFAEFSMESRWEAYLRGTFEGACQGRALQLELLQRRA
jgi:uncharacterized protein (TIGR02270 family)